MTSPIEKSQPQQQQPSLHLQPVPIPLMAPSEQQPQNVRQQLVQTQVVNDKLQLANDDEQECNGDGKGDNHASGSQSRVNGNGDGSGDVNNNVNSGSQESDQEEDRKSDNNVQKSEEDEEEEDSNVKSDQREQEEEDDRSEGQRKEEPSSGKRCFNKRCGSKKIYKKVRSKVEHAKYRFLCKACYQSYVGNDFCEFCQQIYSSTGNAQDDDQWIGCDECNRWNHIQCEKKYRNKNIHQIKDQDTTPYLCLTCSYKAKERTSQENKQRPKKEYIAMMSDDPRVIKQKLQISKEQRTSIFNRKIESLPSLEYFLQNYNFRLWLNENLIKDDLETLRQAGKKSSEDGKKTVKKVKID